MEVYSSEYRIGTNTASAMEYGIRAWNVVEDTILHISEDKP